MTEKAQQWIVEVRGPDPESAVRFGPIRDEGLARAYADEWNASHVGSPDVADAYPLRDPVPELMIAISRGTEIHRDEAP